MNGQVTSDFETDPGGGAPAFNGMSVAHQRPQFHIFASPGSHELHILSCEAEQRALVGKNHQREVKDEPQVLFTATLISAAAGWCRFCSYLPPPSIRLSKPSTCNPILHGCILS